VQLCGALATIALCYAIANKLSRAVAAVIFFPERMASWSRAKKESRTENVNDSSGSSSRRVFSCQRRPSSVLRRLQLDV